MQSQAHSNVVDAFLEWARLTPHAPAVIEGDSIASYRAIEGMMLRAAAGLHAAGWGEGSVAGLALGRLPAAPHLAIVLALAHVGATHVLLSPGELASGEAAAVLRRHRAAGLLTDLAAPGDLGIPILAPDPAWWDPAVPLPHGLPPPAAGGAGPWLLMRSSGTTGAPKEYHLTHAMELARLRARPPEIALRRAERAMGLVGPGFYMGLRSDLHCLFSGATAVARPAELAPGPLFDALDRHGVTYLTATPSHLPALVEGLPDDAPRLPNLRVLRVGSAPMPEPLLRQVMRRLSPALHIVYGANEALSFTLATPDLLERHPDTVGRPIAGTRLELVDEAGQPVPPGRIGHVRTRGEGTIAGYLGNAEETARRFRDGWFHPGDAAVMDAGGLVFLKGRTDDIMNFSGVLVSPQEIERVVLDHPGVLEAAAFGVPSDIHGDRPHVAVVAAPGFEARALIAHCREKLRSKAPVAVLQVRELPRNPMGKVLRRSLTERALRLERQR